MWSVQVYPDTEVCLINETQEEKRTVCAEQNIPTTQTTFDIRQG